MFLLFLLLYRMFHCCVLWFCSFYFVYPAILSSAETAVRGGEEKISVSYFRMDCGQGGHTLGKRWGSANSSLSTSSRSLLLGSRSPDHHCYFSSSSRIHSPTCNMDCSTYNSNMPSTTSMTYLQSNTTTSLGQILLRSPSPSLPRSAPISRKNSALPGMTDIHHTSTNSA